MSYTIYHADGTPVVVPDNAIDTTFYNANVHPGGIGVGTQLIGRNAINYGASVAQNFLQMTENYASALQYRPTDAFALQGQLWFNTTSTTSGQLYVRLAQATVGGDANWGKVVTETSAGDIVITRNATAIKFIGSGAGLTDIPVINPATPKDGDIRVVGAVISIYASTAWRQIFPAVYA